MEIWKEVIGATKYEVSNLGRIRSKAGKGTPKHKVIDGYLYMRTCLSNSGKPMVSIKMDDGKGTSINIARAVYQAFVDNNLDVKTWLYYIDGDFNNCKLENLSTDKKYLVRKNNKKHSEREYKEWSADDIVILKKLWKNKHLTTSSIKDYFQCELYDVEAISKKIGLDDKPVHDYMKNPKKYGKDN